MFWNKKVLASILYNNIGKKLTHYYLSAIHSSALPQWHYMSRVSLCNYNQLSTKPKLTIILLYKSYMKAYFCGILLLLLLQSSYSWGPLRPKLVTRIKNKTVNLLWLRTAGPFILHWQIFMQQTLKTKLLSKKMAMGAITGGGAEIFTMWPSTVKWVPMCQAHFFSSKEFYCRGVKMLMWRFWCNCLHNHLSLVCNMERAHFFRVWWSKTWFLTPPYCFDIEVFNI